MSEEQVLQEQELQEQELEGEEETLQEELKNLPGLLSQIPGAPTADQIEQWKTQFGEVFVFGVSPQEMYIFRPINRKEHLKFQLAQQQNQLKLQQQAEGKQLPNDELLELIGDPELDIVASCVLWPVDVDLNMKAGTVSSLYEQIMQNSNFVPANLGHMLVAKL